MTVRVRLVHSLFVAAVSAVMIGCQSSTPIASGTAAAAPASPATPRPTSAPPSATPVASRPGPSATPTIVPATASPALPSEPPTLTAKVTIAESGSEGFVAAGSHMLVFDVSRTLVSARVATDGEWHNGIGGSEALRGYELRARALPGHPRVVLVGWGGGGCDDFTRLEISADGRKWGFFQGPQISCDAIGVGWYEALTFDHPVDIRTLRITSTGWPTSTAGAEAAIGMARVLTESVRTPQVVEVRSGTLEALFWGDISKQYPRLNAENLAILRATPAWRVTLRGRYAVCGPAGTACARHDGSEDFIFGAEYADLMVARGPRETGPSGE